MSFDDTTEMFQAMHDAEAQERRDRAARRARELLDLDRRRYRLRSFNGGAHLKIEHLSFWPSTGKWHNERTGRRGRLADDRTITELVNSELK